jgi:hypothetical protein
MVSSELRVEGNPARYFVCAHGLGRRGGDEAVIVFDRGRERGMR